MSRRAPRLLVAQLLAVALMGAGSDAGAAPRAHGAAPAGCVMVVLDAAGASHLSGYGSPLPTTPHLDRRGRRSVVFEDVVSQGSMTVASTWSYLNGRYPPFPRSESDPLAIASDAVTLPEAFRRRGFRTAAFTENPYVNREWGFDTGFEDFVSMSPLPGTDPRDPRGCATEDLLASAGAWIASHRAARWFAYVHVLRPHNPYAAGAPYDSLFRPGASRPALERENEVLLAWGQSVQGGAPLESGAIEEMRLMYGANLARVDALLERMLRVVDPGALVVVTADHGEEFLEHGFLFHGGTVSPEGVQVPLMVAAPSLPGSLARGPVELVDLFPTLGEIFALPSGQLEGRSLGPALRGARDDAPRVRHSVTLVPGRWALALRAPGLSLVTKVVPAGRSFGTPELYAPVQDPGERNDLAGAIPAPGPLVDRVRRYLERTPQSEREAAPLPPSTREELRALGYVD